MDWRNEHTEAAGQTVPIVPRISCPRSSLHKIEMTDRDFDFLGILHPRITAAYPNKYHDVLVAQRSQSELGGQNFTFSVYDAFPLGWFSSTVQRAIRNPLRYFRIHSFSYRDLDNANMDLHSLIGDPLMHILSPPEPPKLATVS